MEEIALEFLKSAFAFGIVFLLGVVLILIYCWIACLKQEGGIKLVIKWVCGIVLVMALSHVVRLLIFE